MMQVYRYTKIETVDIFFSLEANPGILKAPMRVLKGQAGELPDTTFRKIEPF